MPSSISPKPWTPPHFIDMVHVARSRYIGIVGRQVLFGPSHGDTDFASEHLKRSSVIYQELVDIAGFLLGDMTYNGNEFFAAELPGGDVAAEGKPI